MTAKAEFASPEWIGFARQYLEEAVPPLGDTIAGVKFSLCEIFTHPPAHLAQGDTDQVAWYVSIDGPTVEVGSGAPDFVQQRNVADYEAALPIARTIYADHPEVRAAMREAREKAAEQGERSVLDGLPPELGRALLGLHDHLARRTL